MPIVLDSFVDVLRVLLILCSMQVRVNSRCRYVPSLVPVNTSSEGRVFFSKSSVIIYDISVDIHASHDMYPID